jgi:Zn-dependent protease
MNVLGSFQEIASGWFLTKDELTELLIATLAVAVAFSWPIPALFPFMLAVSAFGLVLHELAHKYAALNVGHRARFKMSVKGLLVTVFTSVLTMGIVKIGIPGAVHLTSEPPKSDHMAQIALAGPLVNMIVALSFALLKYASPLSLLVAVPNASLAVFNLLPFPPLDGSHVRKHSWRLWALSFGLALVVGVIVLL